MFSKTSGQMAVSQEKALVRLEEKQEDNSIILASEVTPVSVGDMSALPNVSNGYMLRRRNWVAEWLKAARVPRVSPVLVSDNLPE